MAFRLACDIDGTLADMDAALLLEAERLFGAGVKLRGNRPYDVAGQGGEDVPPQAGLSAVQMRQLWAHVHTIENFWTTLVEVEPGAVARLAAVASARNWEVIFLTRRSQTAGASAQVQSQRWLVAHGFALPSVYVIHGSRGKVADALALDAMLDDHPDNCLDVATYSTARPFLLWRDTPASAPTELARVDIDTVFSVAEAIERFERFAPRTDKPEGLVGRLRAAIGL